jgi:Cu-Zn family superoxide dismutase
MNRLATLAVPAALALGLAVGCQESHKDHHDASASTTMKADASGKNERKVATATIKPSGAASTRPAWGKPAGTITFTQSGNKVHITGEVTGLPPGKHAIHVHEKGDMSAPDLMSTGGHYNPEKHLHGGPTTSPVHAGDLGNLTADESGKATMDLTVDNITLGGEKNDVLGRAVIIHEKEDDYKSQPAGNAGARIAGGVIEMKK